MSESPSYAPRPSSADIGVYGLGVMGSNLARNLARHGHAVLAVANRSVSRTQRLMAEHAQEGTLFRPAASGTSSPPLLRCPRVAMRIMVQAVGRHQAVIDQLAQAMEPGDDRGRRKHAVHGHAPAGGRPPGAGAALRRHGSLRG